MEFLEPELQTKYVKCKYIVKLWEHKFKKKYKRVPSKLDIKEASGDVRNAYKKYFELKSAILDESFKGVEGFEDLESENEDNQPVETQKESESNGNFEETLHPDFLSENFKEKTDNLKQSENIEASDEVWGRHLNNQKDDKQPQIKETKPEINSMISKKLFCGSKVTKRNPRKSLSFSQKNKIDSDAKISLVQPSSSFASFTSEEAINFLQNDILDKPFKTITHQEASLSQPLNIVQKFLEDSQPRIGLKSVDEGWLNRVAQINGKFSENTDSISSDIQGNDQSAATDYDYDSEDVIEKSDEEDHFNASQSLHIAKKRKIENLGLPNTEIASRNTKQQDEITSLTTEKNVENAAESTQAKIETIKEQENPKTEKECLKGDQLLENTSHTDSSTKIYVKGSSKIVNKPNTTSLRRSPRKRTNVLEDIQPQVDEETPNTKRITKKTRNRKTPKKTELKTPKKNLQNVSQISERRSSRKTRVKVSLQEFSSGEEEAFLTDTDEKDPEFSLEAPKKKYDSAEDSLEDSPKLPKTQKSSNKRGKKINIQVEDKNEEENDNYDMEFSIKPRIVASRYGSIKNILKGKKMLTGTKIDSEDKKQIDSKQNSEKDSIKDKNQQEREKLEEKIASGNLNENFVRINIRKKVFVRGKKGINFSKYKKSQWKKAKSLCGPDMDMGGCDGGTLTCFNCGQVGHFARFCKATKGDGLLPVNVAEENEDECPFPTLEEASKMAQEANLNVRRPNLVKETRNSEDCDTEENGNDDDPFNDEIDSEELLLETLKLEEYVKKLDVKTYMDTVKVVEPYYRLKEDDTVIDTPVEVFEALQRFGHSSFRPGQEEAIMRILSGKSTLVTLSTGSGKSLCYQLPAYLYSTREPCISLIISPLVSLMDDQIMGIAKFLKAACLHSNQTTSQRKKILDAISLGELTILLVSPEAVVAGEKQRGFSSFLRKLPPIAFACIDEAHCVSQWSHNFRPSYLMICRVLRESLGVKTILGLTATATKATQTSIIEHLQILDGEKGVISDIPLPDNIQLSVSKDPMRDYALLSLLLSDRFKDCSSIIVYCTRRQECERIASFLRTSLKSEQPVQQTDKKRKRVHLQAEPYHAGLAASRRRTIQNAFMSGQLRIVVATVAFGMGINKSDIRAVIHYNMPSSFESYVQEVGRAGRDGLQAQCHVFLDSKGGDENELRRHIFANSIDRHVIRKLLERIFIPCSCKDHCPKHEVAFSIESTVRALDIPEENIATLLCYLELHENKYIELLSPAYTRCKVISYSGPLQIRKVAKECPPLAMALALYKNKEGNEANVLEFPVIDVAAAMGWESGICKHKLKNLEWTVTNNQPARSTINVSFFNLGFRLLAPGNLSGDQLDEALDNLHNRVVEQEKTALLQLNAVHQTLCQVAKPSFNSCLSEESDQLIKTKVREYFNSPEPLKLVPEIEYPEYSEEQLIADIRSLICMYRDNNFTGRAIARIFQGIQSPNYPATIWGRCKYWRNHLDKDFHIIVKTATKEIIRLR